VRTPSRPSYESFMLVNGKKGQVFYTSQPDKNITTLASKFGVKITTENMFAIKSSQKRKVVADTPDAIWIVKVTLL
jgi:hypothetical protein